MAVPSDPPVAVTPVAFRTWALDVSDTSQDHEARIDTLETAPGGGTIAVEDEGVEVLPAAARMNFAGAGVTVTNDGGEAKVTIPGPVALGHKFVRRTTNASAGNDYSTSSTSYAAVDATNLTLTLTGVAVGDVIRVELGAYVGSAACQIGFDACSIVSGAIVNYMSGAGSTGEGFNGWHVPASIESNIGAALYYTVQSGDLSSGSLSVRLYWRVVSGSGTKVMYARPALPMQFAVANVGPAQA